MSDDFGPGDVERFRELVARGLGLHFDDSKLGVLADGLRRRLSASGRPTQAYLDVLELADVPREEIGALARELTVPETYFFRNMAQFTAFSEIALPQRQPVSDRRQLRILSAGCASGEEPYSLAILAAERADASRTVSIRAVDLNPAALEKAAQGRYSPWALRETPPEIQRRWFSACGHDLLVDPGVRAAVTFEQRNLASADPELWRPDSYHVVFCRNVLMYFTPRQAQALVARIATALVPGGHLFVGHAETLRGLSRAFHLLHTHGTFYYQRRDGADERCASNALLPAEAPRGVEATTPSVNGGSWVDEIRRASERIQALSLGSGPSASVEARPAAPHVGDLGSAVELLKRERYGEALDIVHGLPPLAAQDSDVLLLHATLLIHGGQLGEAERVCAQLLAQDEMNAGAHYLLALCREARGDPHGARSHDQVAAYLDPGFAMPHLHLGLLARRAGDREAARRELDQALELLQREEPSRLILFGGGFSRDALVALCRAELVAGGGSG